MYVTGLMLDLAYALRGVSKATEKADYAVTMAKRAKAATLRLKQVADLVQIAEVTEAIGIGEGANLDLNNEAKLVKAANQVAALTKKFTESYDGSTFSAIDGLIPSSDQYRGTSR
jgi:hypothetical protein